MTNLTEHDLQQVSGGVFHAYTRRAVLNNYKSAVPVADAFVSFIRGAWRG